MPVSSPSYFPPNRANGTIVGITAGETTTGSRNFLAGKSAGNYLTQSDVIVIGDSALSAGTAAAPLNDANLGGTIIIGSQSAQAANDFTSGLSGGPSIVVGHNTFSTSTTLGNMLVIGHNIAPNFINQGANGGTIGWINGNIFIGNAIGQNWPAPPHNAEIGDIQGNVFLGLGIGSTLGPFGTEPPQPVECVIIGNDACGNSPMNNANGNGFRFNVVIGSSAGTNLNQPHCILIGAFCAQDSTIGLNSLIIGNNAVGFNSKNPSTCVIIGHNVGYGTCKETVQIGCATEADSINSVLIGDYTAVGSGVLNGARCIVIGAGCGNGQNPFNGFNDILLIGTNDATKRRNIIYADMDKGNIVFGSSAPGGGGGQDLPGTNVVKLLSGTKTGTPVGGGMFYVTGANNDIHWVGSDGTDTNLLAGATGALAYTYNAPLTGFTLTIADDIAQLILEPAGTLASGTVTLPAAPEDGDTVGISTTQTITALTISPNTGQTIADAPTTLGVGGAVRFLYRATNTTWYRIAN